LTTVQVACHSTLEKAALRVESLSFDQIPQQSQLFLDYLRNGRGATAIVAYSTRARPGATVSAPVHWDELGSNLAPDKFTVLNMARRLSALKRDPWADIGKVKQKLPTLT